MGHFKEVSVILVDSWQVVAENTENDWNPFKMTDFRILGFWIKIVCLRQRIFLKLKWNNRLSLMKDAWQRNATPHRLQHICTLPECKHLHIIIGAPVCTCAHRRGWVLLSHAPSIFGNPLLHFKFKNSLSYTHDFYPKSEYSKIGHFKEVSVIFSVLCYDLPTIHQNDWNLFKMTDFRILGFG